MYVHIRFIYFAFPLYHMKFKATELVVAAGLAAVFGYAIFSAKGIPALGLALPFSYEPAYTRAPGFIPKHPVGWVGAAPWTDDSGVL